MLKKLLHNKTFNSGIWYTLSSVLAKGISILITPFFSRILTKAEYGYYTSFVSWQNILVTVFSLELASTVLRAKFDYDDKEFKHYVFSVMIFGVLFSVISVVFSGLIISDKSEQILGFSEHFIIPLGLVIVFSPLIQIFQAEQRAKVKYKLSSLATLAFGIMGFALPLGMSAFADNKLSALLYGIAINAVLWGITIIILYAVKCGVTFKWEYIKYSLVLALPIVPHLISANIMGNSDKLMINSMCGPEFAALYGIIYTCSMAVTLLRNALNNAWVPWFYKKMSEDKYETILFISDIYIFWFSLGTLLICILGREIVLVIGGYQYIDAVPLVPIIMLGCYYNFLNTFYVNLEFYEKKTYMISVVTVITTALNVFLNYICIKQFGYIAAAYTTALCNFLIVLLHYLVTKKINNKLVCNSKLIFGFMFIGVICCVVCIYSYSNLVLRIVLCGIMVVLFVYLFNKSRKAVRVVL